MSTYFAFEPGTILTPSMESRRNFLWLVPRACVVHDHGLSYRVPSGTFEKMCEGGWQASFDMAALSFQTPLLLEAVVVVSDRAFERTNERNIRGKGQSQARKAERSRSDSCPAPVPVKTKP